MSHEISIRSDGRAEAMFAMTPAWHGLGVTLDHAPSSAEAIRQAGLDWTVKTDDVFTADSNRRCDGFQANIRSDTGDVLGVVTKKYRVVQNVEAFDFLDGLLADGIIKYESAGALKGGRVIWALARMPGMDEVAPGDLCARYVLFSASHDGSAAIQATPTSTRVVCANTLRIATSGLTGIRHTGDVRGKLEVARKYISQFDEAFTLFRDRARVLASRKITDANKPKVREYIDKLFPVVKDPGRGKTIRENDVAQIRRNYLNPRQSMPEIKGSWWAVVNSVTELIDHQSSYRGDGLRAKQENKMASVLGGKGAAFKEKAFELAFEMSA